MLGRREPSIYGSTTLDEINKSLENLANQNNIRVDCFQSNHEGEIIDKIHSVSGERDLKGIIINAGGYTHTSIAIRDALLIHDNVPIVEVHLSNIFKRETVRHSSFIASIADSIISGCGYHGYIYGFQFLLRKINGS
tara:strand:+ start:201 stop:611 length:411 start_codon:yes stop_codon:yes gene_type:complete